MRQDWKSLLLVGFALTSCSYSYNEDPEGNTTAYGRVGYNSESNPSNSSNSGSQSSRTGSTGNAEGECKSQRSMLRGDCETKEPTAKCENGSCGLVNVRVSYMLTEKIGSQSVVVEAFDNDQFRGAPVARAKVSRLDTTVVGSRVETQLNLPSGEYYLRAFISTEKASVPYEYGGMELVSNQPIGLYGAISQPERLLVKKDASTPTVVDIYLDTLFKTPQAETPTEAYLRILFSLDAGIEAPMGRSIYIELFDQPDFNYVPVARMEVAAELLRISGREGVAEFVSQQLPVGQYFMRIYLDANGNRYQDKTEPVYVHRVYGETGRVSVVARRTETVEAVMKVDAPVTETPPSVN